MASWRKPSLQSSPPNFDLYLVTDRSQTLGRELLWVLGEALDGGVRAIQLREKDLGGQDLFRLAEKAKAACERYRALLFINDRIDVALGVGADGIQLGSGSVPIEAARELVGTKISIGASVHSMVEAEGAERAGADFILFGPVYFTPSKAAYGEPQGVGRLREVVEKVSLPVYAIGGIKPGNIAAVRKTGVRGVALISAILSAGDPEAASQEILALLRS